MARTQIRMGEVLRYPRPRLPSTEMVDGHRNFFWVTGAEAGAAVQLEAGIEAPGKIAAVDGDRLPVILVSSSPHKVGGAQTPWQDVFDVDNGHIRYFGDNKTAGKDPVTVRGNRVLREAWECHGAGAESERRTAVPLVFFRRVPRLGRQKGFIRFEGFGVARRCELVVQAGSDGSFSNLSFDFVVFDLARENELFDWMWINARRDPAKSLAETTVLAPAAWRTWLGGGDRALPRVRRSVASHLVLRTADQQPDRSSRLRRILQGVYDRYKGREAAFEAVAAWVAHGILGEGYRPIGVTKATGDRGFDFVGRLDLGQGFGAARLVVLGQAKCEKLDTPTNALHLARTVARLRRGWLGVYVTTSYYSRSAQIEVIQDRYPLLLVNGLGLAMAIDEELNRVGIGLDALLVDLEQRYGNITEISDPDQVFFQ